MTLPDYPDWATPVAQIERDVTLTTSVLVPSGGSTSAFDTSGLQTLVLYTQDNSGGIAGVRCIVLLRWIAGGITVHLETVSFHSMASYALLNITEIIAQLPVRGTSLIVSAYTSDGNGCVVRLLGSTRPSPLAVSTDSTDFGNLLLNQAVAAIAAGATAGPYYVPPVSRAVAVAWGFTSNLVRINASGVMRTGVTITSSRMLGVQLTARASAVGEMSCPLVGTEWTVFNDDTVAHGGNFQVWDVS